MKYIIEYPTPASHPKIDKFIPEAENMAALACRGSQGSTAWSRIYIGFMNLLTSKAGLRILGPHDLLPPNQPVKDLN